MQPNEYVYFNIGINIYRIPKINYFSKTVTDKIIEKLYWADNVTGYFNIQPQQTNDKVTEKFCIYEFKFYADISMVLKQMPYYSASTKIKILN